ncbi:MAG: glycosyltransferase family 4 protein, partial [Anaerolineae bacterium]|nr:glycosyltransferase family 4 protein [Anaerolineae bacterium]
MRRLRVALLTLYPLHPERPDSIPGGVWAVGYNMARLLGQFPDLEVHVAHCDARLEADRVLRRDGAVVHLLAVRRRPWRLTIQEAVRRMAAFLRELGPDVANAHAAQYAYAAVQAGVPTVYTVHGVVRREFGAFPWQRRWTLVLPIFYDAVAARRAQAMVAISPYVVREYGGRARAPFHRIEVPISPEFFRAQGMGDPRVLFTAGNLNERKDYLTMLRALALVRREMPDVELRIAGTGDPAYRARLEAFIREGGLEGSVRFLGVLDRMGMVRAYESCGMVLLSSRQETAPGIICEGMAAGRPVVATAVGGVPDMVADGETGFVVPPGDPAALADRTVHLLKDEALRQRMGAAARERALARWWPPRVAEQYRTLYWEVAGLVCTHQTPNT